MAFVCVIGILVFAIGAFLLSPGGATLTPNRNSLDLFSLSARYRPMLRLLDGTDFEFLDESGDPALIRRIRSQRRGIFRGYLRCLRRDHARICAQIRFVIVNSKSDRKDLAIALSRFETSFQFNMVSVQFRLAMHAMGIGNVAATNLMSSLDKIRIKAEHLSAPSLSSESNAPIHSEAF